MQVQRTLFMTHPSKSKKPFPNYIGIIVYKKNIIHHTKELDMVTSHKPSIFPDESLLKGILSCSKCTKSFLKPEVCLKVLFLSINKSIISLLYICVVLNLVKIYSNARFLLKLSFYMVHKPIFYQLYKLNLKTKIKN